MLRNKILYFMILVEVCLLCILYNAYQPVALLWIVVLLPVFLLAWLLLSSAFIRISMEEENVVITRQSVYEAGIVIENHGMIPAGQIQVKGNVDGNKFLIHVYLKGKCNAKVTYPVDCGRCGIKKITISSVVLFDCLKLFKKVIKINKEVKIIIVPKVYEVTSGIMEETGEYGGESETFSENKPGDDPTEVFDIRDYQVGDRLSRIHWKLSTKLNRLMVKEYSRPLPDRVILFLDTRNGEECIDVLFSIGLFMVCEKIKVWINGIMTSNKEEYIMEFMRSLGMAGKILMSEVMAAMQDLGSGQKIICCMDEVNEECMRYLLQTAKENRLYLVTGGKVSKDLAEYGGICVCDMSVTDVPAAIERIMNE